MRPVFILFGAVVLAICQGSGAQESAKTKKVAPATARVAAPSRGDAAAGGRFGRPLGSS